jgi:hypothetical protein
MLDPTSCVASYPLRVGAAPELQQCTGVVRLQLIQSRIHMRSLPTNLANGKSFSSLSFDPEEEE